MNSRGKGTFCAVDCPDPKMRDALVAAARNRGVLQVLCFTTKYSPSASPELIKYSPSASPELIKYSPSASPELTKYSPSASPELIKYSPSGS